MRRLLPFVLAGLLAPALAAPVSAAGSFSEPAPFSVAAVRNGETWSGYSDCLAGYASTSEFRCAWEFNLDGIPFGSIITAATLRVTRTAGDCPANNCPVLLHWYDGNGGADISDVLAGSSVSFSWTPADSAPHAFNVLDQIRDFYARGRAWAGFNLRAAGNYGLYQYFDPAAISLEVKYGQAVTVLVEPFFNGGTGRVASTPTGIKCPGACGHDFADGTSLTLMALPDAGSAFSEWRTGPCAHSTTPTCTFDVPLSDVTVAVTFVSPPPPTPTPVTTQQPSTRPTATPAAGGSVAASAPPTGLAASTAASAAASGDDGATPAANGPGSTATEGATAAVTGTGSAATGGASGVPGPGGSSSTDGAVPLPILVFLLILVIVIFGGGFWFGTRRRTPAA